ncbi:MAG: GGDEF domain-containing protein [Xanthomonadales bacterium]|nr:GGDEF domain-containing protein [Xanthomonadales bacterium]
MKRAATFLLIAVGVTAAGTAAIVGGVALLRSNAQTLAQSRQHLQELADRHALAIDQRIGHVTGFVEHLAGLAVEDLDFDAARADQSVARAHRALLAERALQGMRASGLASAWVHFDPRVLGHILHISYYVRDGRLGEEPEFDVRATGHGDDEWFAAIMQGPRTANWTRPYDWPGWGQIVTYSRAVRWNDQTVGVAGSELFMDDLYREMSRVRLYETGHLVLLNADLDLLFHPGEQGRQLAAVYPGISDAVLQQLRDPAQSEGHVAFTGGGNRWMLAYRRLSNGWMVAAQAREAEVLADHYALRDQILLLILGGSVLSLLLAAGFGRVISRRLDRLAGDLEQSYAKLERSNAAIAAQAEELERLANADALTGTLSRRAGLNRLGEVIDRAARQRSVLSIAYVDINDLKQVNDVHGHDAGDRMICEVVESIAHEVGGHTNIARMGGDELLVILLGSDADAAEALLQAAQLRLSRHARRRPFEISFSYGVVEWSAETASNDVEHWVALADQRMYRHKQSTKSGTSRR